MSIGPGYSTLQRAEFGDRTGWDVGQPIACYSGEVGAGLDREPAQAWLCVRVAIDFILGRLRSSWAKQPLINAA